MSSSVQYDDPEWERTIAMIEARIEDIKSRCNSEYRALHTTFQAQIAELQVAVRKLAREVALSGPDAYVRGVAAQIDELKAKGDAAYELLHTTLPGRERSTDANRR